MRITETKGFKPHKSLLDEPFNFHNDYLEGCVFYLGQEGGLGGDSFLVDSNDYLTIFLMEDMTGHGKRARKSIKKYLPDLEEIADLAASYNFNEEIFAEKILSLDRVIDPMSMIAFTMVRVFPDGYTNFFNIGENAVYLRNENGVRKLELQKGKLGLFKIIPHDTAFELHTIKLGINDVVLVGTDGVVEYTASHKVYEARHENITEVLKEDLPLYEIAKLINEDANNYLKSAGLDMYDDYTFLLFKMR